MSSVESLIESLESVSLEDIEAAIAKVDAEIIRCPFLGTTAAIVKPLLKRRGALSTARRLVQIRSDGAHHKRVKFVSMGHGEYGLKSHQRS